MKIETGQVHFLLRWSIFVDGLLDCDIPLSSSEEEAVKLAKKEYPGQRIITTEDEDHYYNLKLKTNQNKE